MYSPPSCVSRYKATDELLTPTPGDCWNPVRLLDKNCNGCKYFANCTHPKKGNYTRRKKG